jgi:methylenetetrahydrofolate dehydrogenase (NADP+)/methenyltetrahydrofolate cyclohydrolase
MAMSAQIIDGKQVAADLRSEIAREAEELRKNGVVPGLAVVLVGQDPASTSYVTAKERACEENGLYSRDIRLPENTAEDALLALVEELNADQSIHGILVQLPLPKHIDEDKVINAISPEKDVDGFHPVSLGNMMLGRETFLPCTPHGVVQLLKSIGAKPAGKHCVIVGRSNIVGKPLANLLLQKSDLGNATVTVCHSRTPDLAIHTRQADILIAAVGIPELITADMVKDGAVVIDVGVNRVEDASKKRGYRLAGDVAFASVSEKASHITPVPGGVGPMTITMLLWNTVRSARNHLEAKRAE